MEVRCPQCYTPIDRAEGSILAELLCPGCGGKFSLAGTDDTRDADEPRQSVGRFELLERIGFGGFGSVWKARDPERDRTVAVKIPRRNDFDADEAKLLLLEAESAGRLQHPNIVSVLEAGREAETVYIVSDFVHGTTLEDLLVDHRLTSREAVEICVQIADGLQHAHRAGIIHRDLKPSNVIVDDSGVPHMVDFGLAQCETREVTVTLDGRVFGTPAYASPEQAKGESSRIDGRSDVYSLGVMLFELLTGERPFRGNVQMILHNVIHDEAPTPRRYNSNVSRELETICLKCLEKNPNRRYDSAGQLRDDLQRLLDGERIHARPDTAIDRTRKWIVRHPAVAGLLAVIVVVTLAGIAGVTWLWRRAVAEQQRHAHTQVSRVLNADPRVVASVIETLDDFRRWVDPALEELLSREDLPHKHRFRANLALLPVQPRRAAYVFDQLLDMAAEPPLGTADVVYGAQALRPHRDRTNGRLWETLEDSGEPDARRFRAALILVAIHGPSPERSIRGRLDRSADFIADGLIERAAIVPNEYGLLADSMKPVGSSLIPQLKKRLLDEKTPEARRLAAASFFGDFIGSDVERLLEVALRVSGEPFGLLLPSLRENESRVREVLIPGMEVDVDTLADEDEKDAAADRRANVIATLLHVGYPPEKVWLFLKPSKDMRLRSFLIQRFAELGVPQELLAERILSGLQGPGGDEGIVRALLLGLGEYPSADPTVEGKLRQKLKMYYESHPDSGMHSTIGWLLRRWGPDGEVNEMRRRLIGMPRDDRQMWYVNSQGITMAIVEDPPVFQMGSPLGEQARSEAERQHRRKIGRSFAIATTEVTVEQFNRYMDAFPESWHNHSQKYGPNLDGPALGVAWIEAARYCRWLSDVEGFPEEEKCFPKLRDISPTMELPADYLERTGYRLPSEGEWECACRHGTVTRRFYGNADSLVGEYGWYVENCRDRTHRTGLLQPNELGLFDVYGNVWEWCADHYGKLPAPPGEEVFLDTVKINASRERVLRGGSMDDRRETLRSAQRDRFAITAERTHNTGFRIVRTLPQSGAIP